MKRLAAILLSLACAATGLAQEAPSEATAESVELRFLGYGDSFFEGLFFVDPETEEEVPIRFLPDQKSRAYRVPANLDAIAFFKNVSAPGKAPVRRLQARTRLLDDASRQLLVFLENGPGGKGGGAVRFQVVPLDESPEAFGPGNVRFFNLSGAALRGRFGDATFSLPHESVRELSEPASPDRALRLQFWATTSAGERLVFSSRLKPDANYGKLLVIKPPLEPDSFRIRVENLW